MVCESVCEGLYVVCVYMWCACVCVEETKACAAAVICKTGGACHAKCLAK